MDGDIIHDGAHYRVVYRRVSDDPFTVVYFEVAAAAPSREAPPTAQDFFVRRGVNFIGVKPAPNDWYQQDEILAALAAIRAATPGARLAGYGGSMGAYAAINFAHDLGLATLLAVCPQFSILPEKVPFERRWLRKRRHRVPARPDDRAAALAPRFRHVRPAHRRPSARGGDPGPSRPDDAADLVHRPRATALPDADRHCGRRHLGLLRGEMDAAEVMRRVRAARRGSNVVWHGVAKLKLRRDEIASAARAMDRAEATPLPDPFDAAVTRGKILRRLGRAQEAEALVADVPRRSRHRTACALAPRPLAGGRPRMARRRGGRRGGGAYWSARRDRREPERHRTRILTATPTGSRRTTR